MNEQPKLLPCPFCGYEAEQPNPDHPHGGMVVCKSCGASAFGPKWNRRAEVARLTAERDALRAAVKSAAHALFEVFQDAAYAEAMKAIEENNTTSDQKTTPRKGKTMNDALELQFKYGRDNSTLPEGWTLHFGDGKVYRRAGNSVAAYGLENGMRAFLEALTAERDALRAALQPFADLAQFYDPVEDDDNEPCWMQEMTPKLGDLRKARAALNFNHMTHQKTAV